jgi:hypothetical protein
MSKGYVYSIDATLAVFLIMLAAAVAVMLSTQGSESQYGKAQISLAAKDALLAMDYHGALSRGDASEIGFELNRSLPSGVAASLEITTYYYDNGTFNYINQSIYGDPLLDNVTTWGSEYDFVTMANGKVANYSVARMTAWQKK